MVKRNARAYGLSSPLLSMFPEAVKANRSPRATDLDHEISTVWINTNSASADFNDVWILTSIVANVANWEPIGVDTGGGAPISKYIVDADGTGDFTTIQGAINAAQTAGLPATVYVRPGTYTENLTLVSQIDIVGSIQEETIISGVHTPPAAGWFTFQDLSLTSATDILTSAVAGTAVVRFFDCLTSCVNGYVVDCANWTGNIQFFGCSTASTADGIVNVAANTTVILNSTLGAGANALGKAGGTLVIAGSRINCPISPTGACALSITQGCWIAGTLTTAGTVTSYISNMTFSTGANAAINHGSANGITISDVTITSAANPVIAGAGAGVISFGNVTYTSGRNIAATITHGYYPAVGRVSGYVVGPTGTFATVQGAIDAANGAGAAPVDIIVQPGTYAENLTLVSDINIIGLSYDDCVITGAHTPPAAGSFTFQNLTLTSATDIFNSAAAGTTNLTIGSCIINCTNGYTFNLVNWTGNLAIDDSGDVSTANGVVNNTGGSTIFFTSATVGAGAGNPFITQAGAVVLENVEVIPPINLGGVGTLRASMGCRFTGTLTTANTATVLFENSTMATGATAAISHGSAGLLQIINSVIDSSNAPPIGGAGAGLVMLSGVEFPDESGLAGTLALYYDAETRGTKLIDGDNTFRIDGLTLNNAVIQGYGQTTSVAVGTSIRTVVGDLLQTTGNGTEFCRAVEGSYNAGAAANVLQTAGVYGLMTQTDGSVIASTAAGVEGQLDILETNTADQPQFFAYGVKGYLDSVDGAGATPATCRMAGVGAVVEYNTPFNGTVYGVNVSRLDAGAGAGTAGLAAFGVTQGIRGAGAISDWLFGLSLYNGATGVAYTTADIMFQNQSKLIVAAEGLTFTGDLATRSLNATNIKIDAFNQSPLVQSNANTGGVPTGVAGDINLIHLQDGSVMEEFVITAQAILAPRMTATGLEIGGDQIINNGYEYNWAVDANRRFAFVSQTSAAFFIEATLLVTTVANVDHLFVGFRRNAANNANYALYTDGALIGLHPVTAANVAIVAQSLNGPAWAYANTTDAFVNGVAIRLRVNVSAAGVVTYLINGAAPTVPPAAFTFDAGDICIPIIAFTQAAAAFTPIKITQLAVGSQAWI